MISRKPPAHVLEQLRCEVNFGCPVARCGIPYLTWHHFDPPWSEKPHHNPDGMIALCMTHHSLAQGERWTKEQLREMKRSPFVTTEKISEIYGYLRKNTVCIIGNIAYEVQNVLEINGERVIGFQKDKDGYDRLNVLIRNQIGEPILVMENNFWTVYLREVWDLRCSAQGKDLEIVSKDGETNFAMRFNDYPLEEFRKLLIEHRRNTRMIDEFISEIGAPENVPVWSIKGRIVWRNGFLKITDTEIESRGIVIEGSFFVRCRAAFSFRTAA